MAKRTLLYDEQLKLGGKMVEFAGWEMPVQYSSIIDEHKNVRENVGIFDVSHMGEFIVEGKDALKYLQKLVPQDVKKLYNSKAVYCQLTNKQGGIIDDLIIYKIHDEKYFIIVNAARIDEDLNWMKNEQKEYDVKIENISDNYSLFAIQGPKAFLLMEKMGMKKEEQPEFFSIKKYTINNIDLQVSRTGYTGEDGFELLVENKYAKWLWNYILEMGEEFNIKPIGLGARDTLRLEAALHLYGNDLNENTTPVEAGLSWSVAKDKTEDYNGKSIIQNQLNNGVTKKLIGFKMVDRAIARHEYEAFLDNKKIGVVTSGGVSPTLNENIGLAYVDVNSNLKVDSIFQIMVRNKMYNAKVVKCPFVTKRNKIN